MTDSRLLEWSFLRLQLQWCYEGAPGWRQGEFRPPAHRRLVAGGDQGAWMLLQGRVNYGRRDLSHQAGPGDWVILPGHPFTFSFSAESRILSVNVSATWPDQRQLLFIPHPIRLEAQQQPNLEEAARRLLSCIHEQVHGAREQLLLEPASLFTFLQLESRVLAWISALATVALAHGAVLNQLAPMDERVALAVRWLDEQRPHENVEWRALTGLVGLSRKQLDRLFVQELGCTPHAYRERWRLDQACTWLRTTELPIQEIAYMCGFGETAHFSRWFRRRSDQTPSAYRQQHSLRYV